eukprot:INCI15626.1.p1 GENE.INCI15626.1~~INCI15626.1.p1  ORF type:complete len:411 (-),score=46.04 INCI15626.1:240-1472(-)
MDIEASAALTTIGTSAEVGSRLGSPATTSRCTSPLSVSNTNEQTADLSDAEPSINCDDSVAVDDAVVDSSAATPPLVAVATGPGSPAQLELPPHLKLVGACSPVSIARRHKGAPVFIPHKELGQRVKAFNTLTPIDSCRWVTAASLFSMFAMIATILGAILLGLQTGALGAVALLGLVLVLVFTLIDTGCLGACVPERMVRGSSVERNCCCNCKYLPAYLRNAVHVESLAGVETMLLEASQKNPYVHWDVVSWHMEGGGPNSYRTNSRHSKQVFQPNFAGWMPMRHVWVEELKQTSRVRYLFLDIATAFAADEHELRRWKHERAIFLSDACGDDENDFVEQLVSGVVHDRRLVVIGEQRGATGQLFVFNCLSILGMGLCMRMAWAAQGIRQLKVLRVARIEVQKPSSPDP